jgi:hypothetical protein
MESRVSWRSGGFFAVTSVRFLGDVEGFVFWQLVIGNLQRGRLSGGDRTALHQPNKSQITNYQIATGIPGTRDFRAQGQRLRGFVVEIAFGGFEIHWDTRVAIARIEQTATAADILTVVFPQQRLVMQKLHSGLRGTL